MRIYTLQIHATDDPNQLDDLYHYSDFNNLYAKFKDTVEELKDVAEMSEKTRPIMDENGEVRGGFKFLKANGTRIIGAVYDYDILDDD